MNANDGECKDDDGTDTRIRISVLFVLLRQFGSDRDLFASDRHLRPVIISAQAVSNPSSVRMPVRKIENLGTK